MKRPRASSLSTPQHPRSPGGSRSRRGRRAARAGDESPGGAPGRRPRRKAREVRAAGRSRSSTSSSPAGWRSTTASTSSRTPRTTSAASSSRSPRARPASRSASTCRELASASHQWSLVRSLTHPSNDHSDGHLHHAHRAVGRCPPGFNPNSPQADRLARRSPPSPGRCTPPRNNLPPAVVLPEQLIHNTGRVIPGQFAGDDGPAPRPVVHRGVAVRPDGLRRLSRVRVRPPGAPGRRRSDRRFQAPNLTPARRASGPTGSATGWACWSRSTASAATSSGRRRPSASTASARAAVSLLTDAEGPAGLRRRPAPTRRRWTATAATRSAGRC